MAQDWWNDWGLMFLQAGINMDTYKYYMLVLFASRNGIEFIVLDEGWYAPKR